MDKNEKDLNYYLSRVRMPLSLEQEMQRLRDPFGSYLDPIGRYGRFGGPAYPMPSLSDIYNNPANAGPPTDYWGRHG